MKFFSYLLEFQDFLLDFYNLGYLDVIHALPFYVSIV